MVYFFVSGDFVVSWDPVDLGCNAVGEEVIALLLILLTSRCTGPGSRCAIRQIAACELLKTPTRFTPYWCSVSLFSIATPSASLIAHSSASKTSIHPGPRKLRRDLHWFRFCSPQRLPLSHRLCAIHLSTTSRPLLRCWLLSLLTSAVRLICLQWCCPVWWTWPLILRPGPANSCLLLSCHDHDHSSTLYVLTPEDSG